MSDEITSEGQVPKPPAESDPFAAAEDAHGAANPANHIWGDDDERFLIQFSHFEECEIRDGSRIETIVGRQRGGGWTREWLFPPDNPESRGWQAQRLEFVGKIRPELKPGDVIVMELGAQRPSLQNPDRKVRPFVGTHFPA
jgi:hypothetical protein